MFKPYANAPILNLWVNGQRVGNAIYSWKTAKKRADIYIYDMFNPNNQVEILNEETGEIILLKKGMKCRQ